MIGWNVPVTITRLADAVANVKLPQLSGMIKSLRLILIAATLVVPTAFVAACSLAGADERGCAWVESWFALISTVVSAWIRDREPQNVDLMRLPCAYSDLSIQESIATTLI